MKKLIALLTLTVGLQAMACIPSSTELNDDTFLYFDRIYDGAGNKILIKDLIKKEVLTSSVFTARDSNNVVTHEIKVLGYVKGKKGKGDIIRTVYYTKSVDGVEKIYSMNSNEMEDGAVARGIAAPSILESVGCGGK